MSTGRLRWGGANIIQTQSGENRAMEQRTIKFIDGGRLNPPNGSFDKTLSLEFSDNAIVDQVVGSECAELGIGAAQYAQGIAHAIDGGKDAAAVERSH